MTDYRFEPELSRTAACIDGELVGVCQYQLEGDQCLITHTETAPSCQGQGIARELVELCAQKMSEQGYTIVPICSYARKVLG